MDEPARAGRGSGEAERNGSHSSDGLMEVYIFLSLDSQTNEHMYIVNFWITVRS